ncbi:MAG: hypothetical protein C4334_04280 [Pyrinomonas sp.]
MPSGIHPPSIQLRDLKNALEERAELQDGMLDARSVGCQTRPLSDGQRRSGARRASTICLALCFFSGSPCIRQLHSDQPKLVVARCGSPRGEIACDQISRLRFDRQLHVGLS